MLGSQFTRNGRILLVTQKHRTFVVLKPSDGFSKVLVFCQHSKNMTGMDRFFHGFVSDTKTIKLLLF